MNNEVALTAFLVGIVVVFAGLWAITPAAAWIWAGLVLIVYGIASFNRLGNY